MLPDVLHPAPSLPNDEPGHAERPPDVGERHAKPAEMRGFRSEPLMRRRVIRVEQDGLELHLARGSNSLRAGPPGSKRDRLAAEPRWGAAGRTGSSSQGVRPSAPFRSLDLPSSRACGRDSPAGDGAAQSQPRETPFFWHVFGHGSPQATVANAQCDQRRQNRALPDVSSPPRATRTTNRDTSSALPAGASWGAEPTPALFEHRIDLGGPRRDLVTQRHDPARPARTDRSPRSGRHRPRKAPRPTVREREDLAGRRSPAQRNSRATLTPRVRGGAASPTNPDGVVNGIASGITRSSPRLRPKSRTLSAS